jgi:hypothetical protein
MKTLQQLIAEQFVAQLAEDKAMDAAKIEQLSTLLIQGKKVKADELVKIFALPGGADIK